MRVKFAVTSTAYFLLLVAYADWPPPNTVQWVAPTTGLATARWPWKWNSPFAITTNTPEFEAWALDFMLLKANEMREKWKLDIPKPLTLEDVWFAASPTAQGLSGHLMTRDTRFKWTFDCNVLVAFEDRHYFSPSFRYHDDVSEKMANIPSKIGKKEAEAIARNALYKLFGMTEKQLGWKNTVVVNQYKYEGCDGVIRPLPVFHVEWKYKGKKRFAAGNVEAIPMEMEISGIITNIVSYSNYDQRRPNTRLPQPSIPTNYFRMLGLPDSYPDSVPEWKRRFWELTSGTNATLSIPNMSR